MPPDVIPQTARDDFPVSIPKMRCRQSDVFLSSSPNVFLTVFDQWSLIVLTHDSQGRAPNSTSLSLADLTEYVLNELIGGTKDIAFRR